MAASEKAELEDLKMSLRSLVASSPVGMDLRALSRDYSNFEGKRIPYLKFGCTSLLTFVKERCSDIFVLNGDPFNPIVTPIITNKTQHLDQLMSNQKIGSNIKHKIKRRTVRETEVRRTPQSAIIRNDRYSNVAAGPSQQIIRKDRCSNVAVGPSSHIIRKDRCSNVAADPSQQIIRKDRYNNVAAGKRSELIRKGGCNNVAVGTSPEVIRKDGYNNVAVGSSPEVIRKDGYSKVAVGTSPEVIRKDGYSNVAVGTSPEVIRKDGYSNVAVGTSPEVIHNDRYSNVAADTSLATKERTPFQHSVKENKYNNATEQSQRNNVYSTRPIVKTHSYEPVKEHKSPIVKQQTYEPQKQYHMESTQKAAIPMSVHMKSHSYEPVKEHKSPIVKHQTYEPQKQYHMESTQKAAIPTSVHIEARKAPKTSEIEERAQLDTDSSISEASLQVRTANMNLNQRYNILYLNDVKSRLEELMYDYPCGIWLRELDRLYSDKFECNIDYQRLSYSTLLQMCRDMSDVVCVKSSERSGELAVVSLEHTGPLNLQLDSVRTFTNYNANVSVESVEALPGVPYDEGIFPEDCMGHKETIRKVTVQELEVDGVYEVNISEVLDPSHFWFQLRGKQYDLALNTLMDEMLDYYTVGEGKDRQMEFGAVQVGQYCATNFEKEGWHRSVIVQVDLEAVKVRHVDYGSIDKVARKDLRVLLRRWGALPAQAVRGRLPCVKPAVASSWTYQAGTRFLDLVRDKALLAKVHSVDIANQIARLSLLDTNTEKDINISAVLITEGIAELLNVHQEILEGFLLPSFDDLENGRAMNMFEKSRLVAAGVFPEGQDAPFSLPVILRTRERLTSDSQSGTPYTQLQHQHAVQATTDHVKQYAPREGDQFKERTISTSAANTLPLQTLSGCSSEITISHLSIADSDDNSTSSSRIASPMDLRKCKSRSFLCYNDTSTPSSAETLCFNPATSSHAYKSTSQLHKFRSGPTFASIERKIAQLEPWTRNPHYMPTHSETQSTEHLSSTRIPHYMPTHSETPSTEHLSSTRIPHYMPTHSETQSTEHLSSVQATCTENSNREPQQPKVRVSQHVQSFMNAAAKCFEPSKKASSEPYKENFPDHYQTSTESRRTDPSIQYNQQYSQPNDQCSITRDSSNGLYPHQNGPTNYMYRTEHVPPNVQYYPGYDQPNSHYTDGYQPLGYVPVPNPYPTMSHLGLSSQETEAVASTLQSAYPEAANCLLQETTPWPHLTMGWRKGTP